MRPRVGAGAGMGLGERRDGILLAAALALVTLAAGGCLPSPGTSAAIDVARLYTLFWAVAAVVAAIVWGLATWMLVSHLLRRRRQRTREGEPPQIRGSDLLEITWTAIPALTVLGLFGLTVLADNHIDALSSTPAARIHVTAFRWGWRVDYPDAGVEVIAAGMPGPDIAVPLGQPVEFTLNANDVIHSFFVPRFLFKRDAIPSHTTVFDFTVTDEGTYRGQCAEFCGIGHSQMGFSILAMPADRFQAWLSAERGASGSTSPGASLAVPSSWASPGASGASSGPSPSP
ncbi:MAG TPA: cytochrome c oxidase subunit II [Candidatus Dormibacteraeota bacterium]|nr:cytochrome c oxidase subunit II [Candidatus Dormibacteraeota bacterium]